MAKHNAVMCCYDKILIYVAAYVIPGYVCVCVCVCVVQSKQEPEVNIIKVNMNFQSVKLFLELQSDKALSLIKTFSHYQL